MRKQDLTRTTTSWIIFLNFSELWPIMHWSVKEKFFLSPLLVCSLYCWKNKDKNVWFNFFFHSICNIQHDWKQTQKKILLWYFTTSPEKDLANQCNCDKVIKSNCHTAVVQMPEPCNFIKKEIRAQVFSCKFCKVLRTPVFTQHWTKL